MNVPGRNSNITVELEGRGSLILRPDDFVACGGEGTIYRANQTIVKIYNDSSKMIHEGITDKLKILSGLKHRYVVAPQGIVFNAKGQPIGFFMFFAGGEPMPRVFTTAFRQREGFGDEDAKILVERMRETINFAHEKGAILVDANEFNWRLIFPGQQGPEPRIIDVDSWAIGKWPAKVIMMSVKDWHTKGFTKLTDWFTWGIVTFQVFTGIHPYKGTLEGYKPGDLELRMKANASVFSPKISLNRAVRDFKCIPGLLLDWYKETFQRGQRMVPPSVFAAGISTASAAQIARVVTTATGSLIFNLLLRPLSSAIRIWPSGAALLSDGTLFDLAVRRQFGRLESRKGEIVKVDDGWLLADWASGNLKFFFVDSRNSEMRELSLMLSAHQIVRYENRIFAVTKTELVEICFAYIGKPVLSTGRRTSILQPNATYWFDGVGIQEAFGAKFLITPFGENACVTTRVRELDGLAPIAAKAGNRFVTVIAADKSGAYIKFEFTFNRDYSSYTVWQGKTDTPELNIAILPKGVCATIISDGELNIFVPTSDQLVKVRDRKITTSIELTNWGDRVVYIDNGEVWSVMMR